MGKPVTSTGCCVAILAVCAQAYMPNIGMRTINRTKLIVDVFILSPSFGAEVIEKPDEGPEITVEIWVMGVFSHRRQASMLQ